MKKYSDKRDVQWQPSQSMLQRHGQREMSTPLQSKMGLSQTLQGFFGEVGKIADDFGAQNAEIQGQEEAQTNTEMWLKVVQRKKEIEASIVEQEKVDALKSQMPATSKKAVDKAVDKALKTNEENEENEEYEEVVGDDDGYVLADDDEEVVPDEDGYIPDDEEVVPDEEEVLPDDEEVLPDEEEVVPDEEEVVYNIPIASRDLVTLRTELAEQEQFIKEYVDATRRIPTMNIKEFTRQRHQAKMFTDGLSAQYAALTEEAYEKFKAEPGEFKEITQRFTKKLVESLPDNIVGSAMIGFKRVNEAAATKVNQNYETELNDMLIDTTNKDLINTIEMGTKMAYNTGDYSTYITQAEGHLKTLFDKDLISQQEYSNKIRKINKEFQDQKIMGNFDRIIDVDNIKTDEDFKTSMKNGEAEIDKMTNVLYTKTGESLQAYEIRTDNHTQDEVNVMISIMRKKLGFIRSARLKNSKLTKKKLTKKSREEYKKMWSGLAPNNMDELKIDAFNNNDMVKFNEAVVAMNTIQELDNKPLYGEGSQKEWKDAFDLVSVSTGTTPQQDRGSKAIIKHYNENISLAKSDPIALMIKQNKTPTLIGKGPEEVLSILKNRAQLQDSMQYDYKNTGIISNEEANELAYTLNNTPVGQELSTIKAISGSVGTKLSKKLFNKMYKKSANGMIFTAGIMSKGNMSTIQKITNGFAILKDPGFKWVADKKKDLDDIINTSLVQATQSIPKAAQGIREAVTARYVMGDVTPEQAFNEVTNGLDDYNGQFIMPYTKGKSAEDVYDDVTNILRNGNPTMNEPFIGSESFKEEFVGDSYQLVNAGTNKYFFKIKETGVWAVDKQNKPLVFTFKEEE